MKGFIREAPREQLAIPHVVESFTTTTGQKYHQNKLAVSITTDTLLKK